MKYDPRYIALLVLTENSKTRKPLDTILDQFAPQFDNLSKLDRSLANAIIYGTLRWQGYLDWIIQPFSERNIEKLKPEVLYILRIAMFQIVFMDRIPVSAAVNTAVDVAKKISHQGTAGFVNAVLRKASKCFGDVKLPDAVLPDAVLPDAVLPDAVLPDSVLPDAVLSDVVLSDVVNSDADKSALYISVTKSMPLWLVRKWITRFGFHKTLKLCDTINSVPPITIRTNTLKINRETLLSIYAPDVEQITPTTYSPDGISFIKPSIPIHESQPFQDGYFQVQDEAAQLVSMMLNPLQGEWILDACAGLGGKTGHIAQLMKNQGVIVACDADANKLVSLEKEMSRLGIDIVQTVCKDILKVDLSDFDTPFDRVFVDAPCSGLGVLRRNPDAKWKRTKKDLARLGIRQEKMLLNCANLVKPGGMLLYAVCSCETRENDDVVDNFLKKRPDFVVKQYFRTYPDHIEMDGFFAALMEQKNKRSS